MLGRLVALDRQSRSAGEAEEARVLAGAIVVKRRGREVLGRERARCRFAGGPVHAAFEGLSVLPRLREHAESGLRMHGLASVRRAGEGKLRVGQAQTVGNAALDQGQSLQRLDGGSRIDGHRDVARTHHDPSMGVGHRKGAAMATFDDPTAGHFD